MNVEIQAASSEHIPDRANVHYRSWQETYRGLMPDALLDAQTLEKCEAVARQSPR